MYCYLLSIDGDEATEHTTWFDAMDMICFDLGIESEQIHRNLEIETTLYGRVNHAFGVIQAADGMLVRVEALRVWDWD